MSQSYDFSEKPRNKNATFVVWVDWSCRKKDEKLRFYENFKNHICNADDSIVLGSPFMQQE